MAKWNIIHKINSIHLLRAYKRLDDAYNSYKNQTFVGQLHYKKIKTGLKNLHF